ncbi:ROK family protein [Paenibacillus wulumuqiensis]|uniref:ROK family protein n=1 Tax=Paenibacillus wulumuqiensis TaxID=1567107 RepID=UPI0006194E75|nr:ROK family protein [Paenibacillus wulumuqiensis]
MRPLSHSTQQVKKINIELVKNTLRTTGTGTKASIASLTRLSVATCGTILNELVRTGEILDIGPDESSGGRPASRYQFNADYASMVGLIIRTESGIHSITHARANLNGEILEQHTTEYEAINIQTIEELLDQLLSQYHNVQAVGIGIPGVAHNGQIGICDVKELAGQPLAQMLQQRYNGLEITIQNDMNLTVYGLYHEQNYEEDSNFAVLTFPENHYPGAGFIIGGRLLNGNSYFSGEVSYLPFGITREEQLRQLHTPEGVHALIVHTIVSIIAIINPAAIAMTGNALVPSMLDRIDQDCRQHVPAEHMPQLLIQQDTRHEYLTGLITMTLESLTYNIQLIERH